MTDTTDTANRIDHEIELYLLEVFKTLFEHEVRRSRRYKHPLSLIHISVHAEPNTPQTQHAAEMSAINALDAELRDTDIPCRQGSEFMILLPSTDDAGARNACERLAKLLNGSDRTRDDVPYQASAFIGYAACPADAVSASSRLMKEAAAAMQQARNQHTGNIVAYSEPG